MRVARATKSLIVGLLLSILPAVSASAQSYYPLEVGSVYSLSLDTTPTPAAFVGWCPTCAGHMLIGAEHDVLVLSRNAGGSAELGGAWLYAPNTTGNLASGGAVVATAGVSIGSAGRAALAKVPGAAEAVGYSASALNALGYAVRLDAFAGPRIGGANGIPKTPYGAGASLSIAYSYTALAALLGQ